MKEWELIFIELVFKVIIFISASGVAAIVITKIMDFIERRKTKDEEEKTE